MGRDNREISPRGCSREITARRDEGRDNRRDNRLEEMGRDNREIPSRELLKRDNSEVEMKVHLRSAGGHPQ